MQKRQNSPQKTLIMWSKNIPFRSWHGSTDTALSLSCSRVHLCHRVDECDVIWVQLSICALKAEIRNLNEMWAMWNTLTSCLSSRSRGGSLSASATFGLPATRGRLRHNSVRFTVIMKAPAETRVMSSGTYSWLCPKNMCVCYLSSPMPGGEVGGWGGVTSLNP